MKKKIYLVFALALFCCMFQWNYTQATGCNNVTNPGSIGNAQSGCAPFDPALIQNLQSPSGGSGSLQYVWLYKNSSTGNVFQQVSGATSSTYNPGPLSETTYFRRCARRQYCTDYVGESNILCMTVTNCCDATISGISIFNLGTSATHSALTNGASYDISQLPASWNIEAALAGTSGKSVKFVLSGGTNATNIENSTPFRIPGDLIALNLGVGSYTLVASVYNQTGAGGDKCDEKTINFNITQCTAAINNVVVFNLDNSTNFLTLTNGATYSLSTFPANWNIEALVSPGTESVAFTVTGSTSTSKIENTTPFRLPTDLATLNWAAGTYTVNVKAYSLDDASGVKCDEKTITFTLTSCALTADAGTDKNICIGSSATLTASHTGAGVCSTQVITDCNHILANSGGWLENPSASTVCGDNAGTKLWTLEGSGTSYITLDLGSVLPAGTQICASMKLEHCSGTSTSYSNAKIQASTSASSGFTNLTASVTFTNNSTFQEYCYTLASSARYIRVTDNGNCAFRVDYVKYITVGTTNSAVSYLWSTGATTSSISVSPATTTDYTVKITDCKGCIDFDTVKVNVNPPPTCSITGNTSICLGGSTQLCSATAASYLWSTGATTQCISVNAAGTYSLTTTDANGCRGNSCSKTVTVYTPPTCTITGNSSCCLGGSVQLCAAPASSYIWSTGATTQCISVNATGTYSVTITDANGCTSSCNKTVTVNPPPICEITGNTSFCSGGSTQLCGPAGQSGYLWSTGATTQCISVNSGGTYSITVTNANGCTSTCSKTVNVYQTPTCSITGNNSCCLGGSVQLCADPASSYLWSTGATTQCISVNATGTYSVTITDANGCTSTCDKTVTVNPPPTCEITGNESFCAGGSTQLCAPSGLASYLWNTGATTQCISVNSAGTYAVTITNANGCTNTCDKTITIYQPPTCSITGNDACCLGGSTQLCGPAGLAGYLWSTGATTQCISVNTTGSYTLTITNSNGCVSACDKYVTVNPPPSCSISGNSSFCQGGSTQLCAPAGLSGYSWSTGATTQCISVNAGGTYSVTVTNANGCTSSCDKTITVYTPPTCLITGNTSACQGSSIQLCAPAGLASYLWNTGATTQCISVNTSGSYTATITDANGCTSSCDMSVTFTPPPTCLITGNSSFCQGGATQLCAPAGLAGYLWSTGATTQCIVASAGGTYTVTVTDANGCTSSCDKSVTTNPPPTCSISGGNSCCAGGSIQLCAPAGLASYAWSTGATTQCISVNTSGSYTVTVTNANGCVSICDKSVTVHTPPTCLITGNESFCYGNSTQLCAPAGMVAYSWSTGATTQCISVNTAGTYAVTVTNSNGCTSTCDKTITAYPTPTCAITGSLFYCQGSSTQICAPSGLSSYLWNTGATTQCVTVTAGNYTVTVTDANGCTSSCTAEVTARPLPTCLITGSGSICQGSSAQWCAPAAPVGYTYSYLWSTGATTQCVTVNTASTYTVTVTDQYGCSSACNKTLTVYTPPTCSITGGNFCYGSSTQLCAATAAGYLWNTGATTQCITVTAGGTYTVTVTDANGCTSTCDKTITAYPTPTCAITGSLFYCQGSSTQICAPSGLSSYLWNTGATTQCVTVTAGNYTVTVTDANGCTSSCTAEVTARPLPTCLITGSGSICQGSSAQWCAPAAPVGYTYSYLWSTGATTQCVTVNTASTYTVTVTDQYGCSSACNKTLTVYTPPTCSITGGNFCYGSSTQLCAATAAGYLWNTGATTQCITVTAGGTYTVTVTDANGCTSTCDKTITAYPTPTCAITGSLFYCQGSSTQICAPSGLSSYLWNTGATTQCVTVTAGNYTVTVTDANGCTSSCTAEVTARPLPTCLITGSGSICQGSSAQWCAPAAPVGYTYSYLWSTGATTQCVTVSTASTYTVTVTDQYGCSSACNKTLTVYTPPTCSITGGNFCYGSSTQLCAATSAGYLWNTGATTQCITVTAGGTYTVTVTDANGCTSTCDKTITAYPTPTCAITGSLFYCQGSSTQICAPSGLSSYLWNTGATTQCVTVTAGNYTVTVTDANGCTSSCTAEVTARPLPTCLITGSGSICQGSSAQWCAPAAPVGYTYSYLWSTGATTQCVTVNTASTYTVTVTDQYGCSSACNKTLTVYTPPTCSITGGNFCYGSSTQLCAATSAGYLWNTGATTQCITVTAGGTYTVTVTDANGCTSTCDKTITAYPTPTCAITGSLFYCQGSSTQLCAPSGLSSYLWNTGATTQCVTVTAGNYTVTVTDANGCTSSCTAEVTARPLPTCSITGSGSICQGSSAQWCAPAAPVGYTYSYLWSTGATTQCVTVSTASTYTVTVTDQYGCSSACNKTLTVYTPPTCSITGGNFCYGSSTQLCAATAAGYLWNTGATTQCITVTAGGTYTVTVTDANGCTSTCDKTITAYPTPTCAITGSNSCCLGSSVQLCAPAGLAGYLWSTGATTQCVTVNATGTYTVTVTNSNGCTSSCNKTVTVNAPPSCSITGNGSICLGSSTQLCAPAGLASYSWSTGATTQCITVNTAGTFTVTVTNANGCTSTCNKTVTVNNPDDNNACTVDACDPATGNVTHTPVNTNDNNVCTTDGCDPVTGVYHTPVNTNDNNVCTTDGCDPVTGVYHTPVNTNDQNACTTDGCDPVTGVYHNPVNVDDNNVCTTDACNPSTGAITHTAVNTNDNNVCTTDGCDPVTGVYHTPVNTNDQNACTTDGCDPVTGVYHNPVNVDDNNVCTTDACNPSTGAITHTAVNTNDNNVCTTDGCDPVTGVYHTPVNTNDQNACTTDGCDPVTGVYHNPVNVDDNNVCTTDACNPSTGAITHTTVNTNDNNVCTTDGCDPVTGVYHTPVNTNDQNACTTDGCDPVTGVYHNPVNVNDNNVCTTDACNPSTGVITHTAINTDDNNVCTTDGCDPVTGVYHTPVNTNDQNACTTDGCDPVTGVYHNPVNVDDNNVCTTDACNPSTGAITHTAVNTNDNNVCTTDGCDPVTGVYHTPVNTNDQNACTTDGCDPVTGVYHNPVNVDDGIPCTVDACDPATGVITHTGAITPPNPTITGVAIVCTGTQNTYTAVGATGATTYLWTVPTGANIMSGQGTATIVVSFTTQCQSGNICVTASNSCGTANQVCKAILVIKTLPVITGSISGQSEGVCVGATVQYCITAIAGVTNYVWTIPANSTIVSGQGTNCITVNFLAGFTTGSVTVKAQNCKGYSSVKSLTVRMLPLLPGAVTGPATNLCLKTAQVYTVTAGVGATSYLWTVPTGANIVSGQGTTSITVDFAANFVNGSVTVKSVNGCGTSALRTLAVKAKAATPATITGLAAVCANTVGVAYSITPQPGVNYNWTVPAGSSVASGQGTANITVNWASTSGNVSVTPNNACGNGSAKSLAVTVSSCVRGIDDESSFINSQMLVYPNPVKSVFTVEFNAETESEYVITITDMIGKEIYFNKVSSTEGINKQSINAERFAQGLYLLTLKGNNVNKSVRVTVE